MFCKNGFGLGRIGQVNSRCLQKRFYSLFYEWSSLGCVASPASRSSRKICTARPSICTRKPVKRDAPSRRFHNSTRCRSEEIAEEPFPKEKDSVLADEIRKTMRNMPTSVVVITSRSTTSPTPDLKDSFAGMTVSSFTCLSLAHHPIITFNIKFPSSTLTAIRSSRKFWIHILEGTWRGAHIADAFTRPIEKFEAPVKQGSETKFWGKEVTDTRLWEVSDSGLPLLIGRGVMRIVGCELIGEGEDGLVKVGDHVVVLGRVVDVGRPGEKWCEDVFKGLCYLHGRYQSIGGPIPMRAEWMKEPAVASGDVGRS